MNRKCLGTSSHPRSRGVVRLRGGGGEEEAETPARRQGNPPPASGLLGRYSISRRQKWATAQREGEAWTSGGVSEAAERPPIVPCLREEDHTCQQSWSDVRRAGTASREHSSGPGAPRKSGFCGHPSLLPLPKLTLPASAVVAVGSGSKTPKPRPHLGASRGVLEAVPEGNPSPLALAGPQDVPSDNAAPATFRGVETHSPPRLSGVGSPRPRQGRS